MFKLDKIFLTLTRKNFTTSTNEQYKALLNKVGSFLNKVQSTSPEM